MSAAFASAGYDVFGVTVLTMPALNVESLVFECAGTFRHPHAGRVGSAGHHACFTFRCCSKTGHSGVG